MEENFQYDVAFSFLVQDESIAIQLNNLLKYRVKTFIYTEQQKKLAGGDGETLFNNVFCKESRTVVVLYRENWGKATWTKIEETAIRNRGFQEGYDFVLFIPLDQTVNPPAWLPKHRIWIGYHDRPIDQVAAIIEARIQEQNGTIKVETVTDKALKIQEEIEAKLNRTNLLANSRYELMKGEYQILLDAFKSHIEEIQSKLPDWRIALKNNRFDGLEIISYGHQLSIQNYGDYVFICYWDGTFDDNGTITDFTRNYKSFGPDKLRFDIDENDQHGWSNMDTGRNFKNSTKLADEWLTRFIETIKTARLKKGY